MVTILVGLAGVICYGIATAQLFRDFSAGRPLALRRVWPAALVGLALHGYAMLAAVVTPDGINRSLVASLSMMAWIINALIIIGASVRPMRGLGMVTFPAGAVLLTAQLMFGQSTGMVTRYSWQMETHIAIALFSFAILAVAAAQAALLATQERLLRSPSISTRLAALPPLTTMEQLLFQLIGLGFVLLTITVFTGVIFVDNLFDQSLVHKTAFTIISWFVFGALLWGRWRYGWRGRRAIRLTLIGFSILVLAYFGTKFVLEVILQRF